MAIEQGGIVKLDKMVVVEGRKSGWMGWQKKPESKPSHHVCVEKVRIFVFFSMKKRFFITTLLLIMQSSHNIDPRLLYCLVFFAFRKPAPDVL